MVSEAFKENTEAQYLASHISNVKQNSLQVIIALYNTPNFADKLCRKHTNFSK